ncbi:hypothetical protein RB594_003291 [Gaeumannomyces avenae]
MPSTQAASPPASSPRMGSVLRQTSFTTALRPSWDTHREVNDIYRGSSLNFLVVLVPVGIAAGALGSAPAVVFWLNLFALLPLGPLLWLAANELSVALGPNVGGLLRECFPNLLEMIIVTIALTKGMTHIVQAVLIGSVLSYSLMVLGGMFFCASIGKERVYFDKTLTSILSSLLIAVAAAVVTPSLVTMKADGTGPTAMADNAMAILSHANALILFLIFLVYLQFRLRTHRGLFKTVQSPQESRVGIDAVGQEDPDRTYSKTFSTALLVLAAVPACACSTYLLDSIEGMAKATDTDAGFIALVLVPAAGNGAKAVAIIAACRRRSMDVAIRVIMSSVLNNLLFALPFSVLLGWIVRQPMYLDFDVFEATVLFISIIIMSCMLQYGRTSYFEGAMLMGTYLVVAVAFFVRPAAHFSA